MKSLPTLPATADVNSSGEAVEPTSGWVIEVKAHHFHNSEDSMKKLMAGKQYVLQTVIEELLTKRDVILPDYENLDFTYSDLGISYPTISWVSQSIFRKKIVFDPTSTAGLNGQIGPGDEMDDAKLKGMDESNVFDVRVYAFVIQMAWIPRTNEEILAARTARLEAEAEQKALEEKKASEEGNSET